MIATAAVPLAVDPAGQCRIIAPEGELVVRAFLIALLVLSQGVSSLAGGLTLCLHADGGFCVELPGADCCGHHLVVAVQDDCCGASDEHSAGAPGAVLDASTSDCTHVALPHQTQVTSKIGGDRHLASTHPFFLLPGLGHWQLAAHSGNNRPQIDSQHVGDNDCGALSFLAPVMLRC